MQRKLGQRPVVSCALAIMAAVGASADALTRVDPNQVIHGYFPTAETGFDPCRVTDLYSNTVNEAIFERPLTYDYLARPAKLVPMVAEAMPEVSDPCGVALHVPRHQQETTGYARARLGSARACS